MDELTLGIDIGGTYCKAVLVDEGGQVRYKQRALMPSFSEADSPLIKEQDVATILEAVATVVRSVIGQHAGRIKAVGLAGQMHGVVLVDESLKPLTPFISWQDQRTTEHVAGEDYSYFDHLKTGMLGAGHSAAEIMRPGMLGPLAYWLKEMGQLKSGARVAFIADYVAAWLCESDIVADPTEAAGSGIYDVSSRSWNETFFTLTGVEKSCLPELVESGHVVGLTTKEMEVKVGLPSGVPVCASIGDYHAALFASKIDEDSISLNVGTGAQVSLLLKDEGHLLADGFEMRPFFNGYSAACLFGLPGGRNIAAFEQFIVGTLKRFSSGPFSDDILGQLDAVCSQSGFSTSLQCDPNIFYAEAEAGFNNLSHLNFNIEYFYYAFMQGIVEAYYNAYKNLKTKTQWTSTQPQVVLSGGVSQKSKTFQALVEKRFEIKPVVSLYDEEAAVGAALLAQSKVKE